MAQEHSAGIPTIPERAEVPRRSDDSENALLRSAPRPLEPRVSRSQVPEPYLARLEFDPPESAAPRSSRQVTRWAPPLSEYDYDYDDRGPRYRASYDYGRLGRRRTDGYDDDDPYYNRPYPRAGSVRYRSEAGGGRGPPPPRKPPRRRPEWHEPSDDDGESEEYESKRGHRTTYARATTPPEEIMRLPFTMWMNSNAKNHFVAAVGEFVGTTMFLFFAFAGTQVANIGAQESASNSTTGQSTGFSPIVLLYIAISFGFSLMVNVWIFFRISGGLFNPAVTLAMALTRAITIFRACLLFAAQIAGAIFSSYIVSILFPTSFNVVTTLSQSTSLVQGVFIEAILTAELVFTIFMLAKEKHKATFMAPVGIGLALFVAELVGVFYTGGSLNPARSFGPCVVTGKFGEDHWIYWVGPAAGAIVAMVFYKFIKILEYEVANPGQDEESEKDAAAAAMSPARAKKETSAV